MASSPRKKTAAGKSKSGGARKAPQKQPIRREVGAGVLFVLTLCILVSYLGISALFIDWLAKLLKGLFGYGYWLATAAGAVWLAGPYGVLQGAL